MRKMVGIGRAGTMGSPGDWLDPDEARAAGRTLRRRAQAGSGPVRTVPPGRSRVVDYLDATNRDRLPELVPERMRRMAASPFSFLRGAAGLMAGDLAAGPVSGLTAQLCGDAHAANFGLYGGGHGQIVMDINDFDETIMGPWEWDLKRLTVSLVLAGREGGVPEKRCVTAARHAARAYRRSVADLAGLPFLDSWAALGDRAALTRARAGALQDDFAAAAARAAKNTSARVAAKWTHTSADGWHFVADPPLLGPVDQRTHSLVIDGLAGYVPTLHHSRQHLIARYRVCDVAMRVVGTGSVGFRSYLVLLRGNGDKALVLQVKQARPSALAPFLAAAPWAHEGERIVHGARLVQADTDVLLGWTTIDNRPFVVRQFRNRKGMIDPALLPGDHLDDYGRLAGSLLARAHVRSTDPRVLDGYCQDGDDLDEAIAAYAVDYADQTERDHAELVTALRDGDFPPATVGR